jgi:hypothetical protein
MFPVREPDYAGLSVRRPEVVRNIELFEAQHASAALREMVERRAAHPADADDDRVEDHGALTEAQHAVAL